MVMKIKCSYTEILDIDDPRLIPNPDNPNDHSKEQIIQLGKILDYQGQRKALNVSNQSGFIVTGHGTLMAAKQIGAKQIAVDFQDYDNEAMEYAHVVADNAIALQSELDRSMINEKFVEFGPDFDLDMFGFDDFKLDASQDLDLDQITDSDQFIVSITCKDETDMSIVYDEMTRRGYDCKLIK